MNFLSGVFENRMIITMVIDPPIKNTARFLELTVWLNIIMREIFNGSISKSAMSFPYLWTVYIPRLYVAIIVAADFRGGINKNKHMLPK